jgi:hypothetical protein
VALEDAQTPRVRLHLHDRLDARALEAKLEAADA